MWRRALYASWYRTGRTPWDTGITPPEVVELVDDFQGPTPGRALDLGCGTGTNVAFLAAHGWQGTGVDASARAIATARAKLGGTPGVRLVHGDVTRLDTLGLDGPFDLVLDIGCFHSIAAHRRDAYAAGVARHAAAGARLFVFAFARRGSLTPIGVTPREMRDRFAPWFEPIGRIGGAEPAGAAWYLLRRTDVGA